MTQRLPNADTTQGATSSDRLLSRVRRRLQSWARRARLASFFRARDGLLVLALGLGAASAVGAQTPALDLPGRQMPPKTYMSKGTFYLPIQIEDRVRAGLREVLLFVKDNPSRPWMLKEKATPSQTWFSFKAPQEGEYWFTVVTVDKSGRAIPADVTNEPPALIVVLDTKGPEVEVHPLPAAAEGQVVRCDIRDPHADSTKTKFFYQTGDQMWRPLDAMPGQPNHFCIPAQAVVTGMVRVSATDLAGNTTTREMSLGALAAAAGMSLQPPAHTQPGLEKQASPLVNPPLVDLGPSVAKGPTRIGPPPLPSEVMSAEKIMPPPILPKGNVGSSKIETPVGHAGGPSLTLPRPAEMVSLPSKGANVPPVAPPPPLQQAAYRTGNSSPAPLTRQVVNNTRVYLEYQIEQAGASGIGKVEVWLTHDRGQSWQKLSEDADRRSPIEVNLPGEGLFGVSLVVSNGRGFGLNPPRPGDAPDYWIEVDVTKPTAELQDIRPGTGDDAGTLLVCWTARDNKDLSTSPIDLYFSIKREGPWQTLAKGLKNDGVYRWQVPTSLGAEAYLRLAVSDRAGNITYAETAQAVALDDLSRPRARVLGVATATPPAPPASQEN
jgi:hypothetical protein